MPVLAAGRMLGLLLCVFARSTAHEPSHPILTISGSGSGADDLLNDYTEEQFLQFVPLQAPRDQSFLATVVSGDTGWSWSNTAPNQLLSTPSNTVFPTTDPAYPEFAESVVVFGKTGLTTVQVPYYLAAGSTTRKALVQAYIDNRKRGQLRPWLGRLAAAYVRSGTSPATRDDRYARRIALALDAWAHAVPNYFMTEKNGPFINATTDYVLTRDIQRASDRNGMAHEWNSAEILAFDAIHDSTALATLSAEKGYDVRAHIRDNLFFDIGDYFKDRVPVSVAINTNLSGPFSNLALVARAFNRPDYITYMGDYLDNTINKKLNRDGVLVEGISYSDAYLAENLKAAENTRDYFLTRPADTPELAAIRAATTGYADIVRDGRERWNAIRLPNGQFPPFGDTNFNIGPVRDAGNSAILGAYGHAALGAGSAAEAVQLNINFSTESNHMRADVGAFTLWALGTELLGNVRYFNATPGRQFGEQILSHNAVTIDRSNMSRGTWWNVGGRDHVFTPGHLHLYEPGDNGFAVTEIDAQRPYADKASRYQRILILNTADLARPYVIDVFRVSGGATHDYTLHGSIRYDQVGESSFPLTPNPATHPLLEGSETWTEPTSGGSDFPYYGYFRNVSSGTAPENFQITFRESPGTGRKDVRLWVTKQEGAAVHLARTPIAARGNGRPADFYDFWRPSVIVRQRIASGTQQSLFANVIEPLRDGASTIQSVQQLPLAGGDTREAVALRITFTDGRVDTCLVNLRNPRVIGGDTGSATIATADGRYSLTGRIGAHLQATSGSRIWTMAASDFTYAGNTYTPATQVYTGTITGITRRAAGGAHDAFIVSGALPGGTALRGRHLSMTFGSYRVVNRTTIQTGLNEMFEIDRVETIGDETHVVLASDPHLAISGTTTTELMAPQRTFTGANTYEIALGASAPALAPALLTQTITFPDLPAGKRVGDADFALGATASSGLAVTYASSNPSVATIVDGRLRLVAAGITTITASQTGDTSYDAAAPVVRSIAVTEANELVFFGAVGDGSQVVGSFAAHLDRGGTRGQLLGFLQGRCAGFVVSFTLDANGAFTTTTQPIKPSQPPAGEGGADEATAVETWTFRGQFARHSLAGSIDELALTYTAVADPFAGPTASMGGSYSVASLGPGTDAVYSVVGASGSVYALARTADLVAAGAGALDAWSGDFHVDLSGGAAFEGNVDAVTTAMDGAIVRPGGDATDFAGLRTGTARTDRLVNLSSRARVGSGENVVIAGFVVGGDEAKSVLLRAVGPGLEGLEPASRLADPRMTLVHDGVVVATNDDWGSADNAAAIAAATLHTGAFPLEAGSKDAAMLVTLPPGVYTAVIEAANASAGGVALAEIYDASLNPAEESQRLLNISTRGYVGPGDDTLIAGFVVTGNAPKRVLVRGIGPTLAALDVADPVADPTLTIFQQGDAIARNSAWGTGVNTADELVAATTTTGAFPLDAGSKDAAVLVTFAPGVYTAHVTAESGADGIALIEVYELPTP